MPILKHYCILVKTLILSQHVCNPSYSGGKDQEDYGVRPDSAKKVCETPISVDKSWTWWHTCHPSDGRKPKMEDCIQVSLGKKQDQSPK
jgi:hypothetical protein